MREDKQSFGRSAFRKGPARLVLPALLALSQLPAVPGAVAELDMRQYKRSCGVCHDKGTAGAQTTHDTAAWEPVMAKGMEALVASTRNGLNGMPPNGMCFDCSDEDFADLIRFMASPE